MSAPVLAAVLLGVGALGGAGLFALRLRGSNPPLAFAMVHGLAAAAGLITLAVAVLGAGAGGLAAVALWILVVAALGGAVLIATHLRGVLLPIPVIFVHGLLAATGFICLLLYVVR